MSNLVIKYQSSEQTGAYVSNGQFGANALHAVNIVDTEYNHGLTQGFQDAIESFNITRLRYPGGHVESSIDITSMPDGKLRHEVRAFMEYCKNTQDTENKIEVTIVLPTKIEIPQQQIENFVSAILKDYGDIISAFEIGNEYSIGPVLENVNRTVHPENLENINYAPAMNEKEYGIAASRVINSVQNAIDALPYEKQDVLSPSPKILLQIAETSGRASSYKGGAQKGGFAAANDDIISQLDDRAFDAVDGAVAHYYYNVSRSDGETFEAVEDWREIRRIDERYDSFIDRLGKEVDLYITEWNVVASNTSQHGAASASILLEMFEFMVRLDVKDSFIWPLQHRAINNILGSRDSDGIDYSMSGAAFSLMSDSLRPTRSSDGREDKFESVLPEWSNNSNGEVEINHFQSSYQSVFFLSFRGEAESAVTLDLSALEDVRCVAQVLRLTIDPESSDGLSDYANEDGKGRISRRVINDSELKELRKLVFFDETDANHVKYLKDGRMATYLPPSETILLTKENPKSIDDYYFTAEADVRPKIIELEYAHESSFLSFEMLPYDVVRVTVEHVKKTIGTDHSDILIGGIGSDSIHGGNGSDKIRGDDGDDFIFGGKNDNDSADVISGGFGNDFVDGGFGNDLLWGNSGDDTIIGGYGSDRLMGGVGSDVLTGSAFGDYLFGGDGNDFLNGGYGFDRLNGGPGADRFYHSGHSAHKTDWMNDFNSAEGDLLVYGARAKASDFHIIFDHIPGVGDTNIAEASIVHSPSGQTLWILVDGSSQDEINLQVRGDVFDLLA